MPPTEPLTPATEKLVRDLAAQAGLVVRNVRLVEDLLASRQRLVAAQDQERRKLERNLHDGAQRHHRRRPNPHRRRAASARGLATGNMIDPGMPPGSNISDRVPPTGTRSVLTPERGFLHPATSSRPYEQLSTESATCLCANAHRTSGVLTLRSALSVRLGVVGRPRCDLDQL
jgi:hypothetical protein